MNVYDSIVDSIQELDQATRGEIYVAVIEYLRFGREPDLEAMSQIARVLFQSFRPNLDNQIAKSEAGKRGGKSGSGDSKARQGNRNASKTQAKRKQNASKTQANRNRNRN